MDFAQSESATASHRNPPTLSALALLLGGIVIYFLVWDVLDPPRSWDRCAPPSSSELAELSARRSDFLLVAIPLVAAYSVLVAARAWTWAADRRARQGHHRRPGRLAYGTTAILGVVWFLLLGDAFITGEVGAAIFWGFLLAAAGAVVSAVLAIGVVFTGAFDRLGGFRSEHVTDSLVVGLAWSIMLFGVPLLVIGLAVPGNDATLWC